MKRRALLRLALVAVIVCLATSCGAKNAGPVASKAGYLYLRPVLCLLDNGPNTSADGPADSAAAPIRCQNSIDQKVSLTPKGQDVPSSYVVLPNPAGSPFRFAFSVGPADSTQKIVAHAAVTPADATGSPDLRLTFTSHGIRVMQRIASERGRYENTSNKSMEAFDLDGVVISTPILAEGWHGDQITIGGDYSKAIAEQLAGKLNRL